MTVIATVTAGGTVLLPNIIFLKKKIASFWYMMAVWCVCVCVVCVGCVCV